MGSVYCVEVQNHILYVRRKGKAVWCGNSWGDEGYFKMARGTNVCEIEENVITGVPDFFYPTDYSVINLQKIPHINIVPSKVLEVRKAIDKGVDASGRALLAGGIDPTTGFSRRVLTKISDYDFRPPIRPEDTPDWETYIAGVSSGMNLGSILGISKGDGWVYIAIVVLILLYIGTAVRVYRRRMRR